MVLFDELDKSGLISVQPMYLVVAVPDDDDDSSIMILPISMAAVNMPRSLPSEGYERKKQCCRIYSWILTPISPAFNFPFAP